MTKKPWMSFPVMVGICVLFGALSELFHYYWLWDYELGGSATPIIAYFVVPGLFLSLSILFDAKEGGKPRGKVFGTASRLFLLFATSLHFVILTLPEMRILDEGLIKWWSLLLLPLGIEILLAHLAPLLFERHPKLFLVIKYFLFVMAYAYGLFVFWVYGLAGAGV